MLTAAGIDPLALSKGLLDDIEQIQEGMSVLFL
jgi:hypothetical protein